MPEPFFDLAWVQRLAAEDRFLLNHGPACLKALEDYLHGELGSYRPFAQAVVAALRPEDFFRTRRWPDTPTGQVADEYGIAVPPAVLTEFGVDVSTWYVKVTVQRGRRGEALFFMSLHPLAFVMERRGGRLHPER